jgi:hypothetical protein
MRPRPPEPKGKLDAVTGYSFSTPVGEGRTWVRPAVAGVAVARTANGPEDRPREQDAPAEWDKINWRAQEGQVRRLRQRIFKASQEQDWAKVRNLQELMLRSRANTLVSVRQVTQRNAGRKTPGIDGEVALTSQASLRQVLDLETARTMASYLHHVAGRFLFMRSRTADCVCYIKCYIDLYEADDKTPCHQGTQEARLLKPSDEVSMRSGVSRQLRGTHNRAPRGIE